METATILHADLDAFYASVEQLLDPRLRGHPIAVGGGVVLAASYEARAYGVRGGMSGWQARQLCPQLRFVGGHFREYQRLADRVIAVFHDFTPVVERISIDEAFLDVRGATHLFGPPAGIAAAIRRRVRAEIGLSVSIGVARTKHLAKVASQVAKPDGLVVVPAGEERTFLGPLPVELMWGVGPATEGRLHALGVRTIGELAAVAPDALQHVLGNAHGTRLSALAQDHDPRQVTSGTRAKSVGAQSALGRRPASGEVLDAAFARLADRVASRMRAAGLEGRTVTVRVRFPGMRAVTRSVTFPDAVASTRALAEVAATLAARAIDEEGEQTITLVAVSVSHLRRGAGLQLPLPFEPRAPHDEGARWALDRSVDAVREKFGRSAVGYAPVVLGGDGGVPDDFRALAEHDLME